MSRRAADHDGLGRISADDLTKEPRNFYVFAVMSVKGTMEARDADQVQTAIRALAESCSKLHGLHFQVLDMTQTGKGRTAEQKRSAQQ